MAMFLLFVPIITSSLPWTGLFGHRPGIHMYLSLYVTLNGSVPVGQAFSGWGISGAGWGRGSRSYMMMRVFLFVCFCLFCCCFNLLCNHCSTPNAQPGELLLLSCWAALAELEWHNRVLLWRTHMFSGPSLLASWKVKYHGCIWKISVGLVCKKLSCLVDLHWSCYMAACAVIQILILSSYSMFAQQNVI